MKYATPTVASGECGWHLGSCPREIDCNYRQIEACIVVRVEFKKLTCTFVNLSDPLLMKIFRGRELKLHIFGVNPSGPAIEYSVIWWMFYTASITLCISGMCQEPIVTAPAGPQAQADS